MQNCKYQKETKHRKWENRKKNPRKKKWKSSKRSRKWMDGISCRTERHFHEKQPYSQKKKWSVASSFFLHHQKYYSNELTYAEAEKTSLITLTEWSRVEKWRENFRCCLIPPNFPFLSIRIHSVSVFKHTHNYGHNIPTPHIPSYPAYTFLLTYR